MDYILSCEVVEETLIDEDQLNEIRNIVVSDTQLISLYIRPHQQGALCKREMSHEVSGVQNIKDTNVGSHVKKALLKIKSMIPDYSGDNGVALFAGVDETGEMRSYTIYPSFPMKIKKYQCGSTFLTAPLEVSVLKDKKIGIIAFGKELFFAETGFVVDNSSKNNNTADYKIIYRTFNPVPKKHHKGGQSANRFAHTRIEISKEFANKIIDKCFEYWSSPDGIIIVEKIIFTGSGAFYENHIKEKAKFNNLPMVLREEQYNGEYAIKQIARHPDVTSPRVAWEITVVQHLFSSIADVKNKTIIYGRSEVLYHLNQGLIKCLFIGRDIKTSLESIDEFNAVLCKRKQSNEDNEELTSTNNVKVVLFTTFHSQFDAMGGIMAEVWHILEQEINNDNFMGDDDSSSSEYEIVY